ncbi:MAG: hypothetical protein K2H61_05025 [Muribaculaceae bacterium]|nr:hypothetical protein [Muribaculaceae bacterium]
MNKIIEHLDYLLRRHDCVVVPGLGAFIARRVSAKYDSRTGVFTAPGRELAFNSTVTFDDGLLAASVARKEQITIERATQIVAEQAEAMNSQLNVDGEISIGAIGSLVKQSGGETAPIFKPYPASQAWLSMGWEAIKINELNATRSNDEGCDAIGPSDVSLKVAWRRFVKIAASVAIVLMIGVAAVFPLVDNRNDNMAAVSATLNSFVNNSQTSAYPSIAPTMSLMIAVPEVKNVQEEAQLTISEPAPAIAEEEIERKEIAMPRGIINDEDRYCLVVASLPSQALAEQFVRDNSDFTLEILHSENKYRVFAATGATSADALSLKKAEIANRFPDAWVCRR